MHHQCPFPVRASDTRSLYRTGNAPGFTLTFALVAILAGYASLSEAIPFSKNFSSSMPGSVALANPVNDLPNGPVVLSSTGFGEGTRIETP